MYNAKIVHSLNKLHLLSSSIIANTIAKKRVDAENHCFLMFDDVTLVNQIVKHKKSFARFGDGELSLILNKHFNIAFQHNSPELQSRLKQILNSDLSNLIIGISVAFNDPSQYSKKVQRYFRTFNYLHRKKYKKLIPTNKIYGNASIARFYIDYEYDTAQSKARLANLRRIWHNRDILIVEGQQTKLGVGNDLLNNANTIRRIIIPAINAFESYNKILSTVKHYVKDGELILISAGPTATILAYDLAKTAHQAVDIGHIDIEYEWMLRQAKKRITIPGKYVNEVHGDKYIASSYEDSSYHKQIICSIK